MDVSDDSPQLGRADVDREALEATGVSLADLADELAAAVDSASAVDAPSEGWRVLRRHPAGSIFIGAPIDSEGLNWRVAQAELGTPRAIIRVHPDVLQLRPSRAERRRGLQLSWPSIIRADGGPYAIDVVNVGNSPWTANGDSFHAVGVFSKPGEKNTGFTWTFLGHGEAVPLGPGDYARVPVTIDPSWWGRLEPGTYELSAVLVDLGLRAPQPLLVTLSSETIAGQRAKTRQRQQSPDDRRRSLDARAAEMRALMTAGDSLVPLATALAEAGDEADALERIMAALECDSAAAQAIYRAPLRELLPGNAPVLRQRLEQLEQHDRRIPRDQ